MDSVLRRKLSTGRPGETGGETAARAWRVAFARAARDCTGLDIAMPVLRDDRRSLGELLDLLPERAMLAVLEGPAHALGLLALSPGLLAAVIEAQTIGRVNAAPPPPRRPTRTDAALTLRLIDTALGTLETALRCADDLVWTAGFRYASFLDDARPLGLLLDDTPYRVLAGDIDIAAGARQGSCILALPAEGRGPRPAPRPANPQADDADWAEGLTGGVMAAEVSLQAIIGHLHLPLGRTLVLQEGMILPLGPARIDAIRLVGPGGETLATCKLGQLHGMRAIRLREDGAAKTPVPKTAQPPRPAPPAEVTPPLPLARTG